jgi:hypothetical protein
VKDGVLRVGDILAYKRNFSGLGLVVLKDTIVSLKFRSARHLYVELKPDPID